MHPVVLVWSTHCPLLQGRVAMATFNGHLHCLNVRPEHGNPLSKLVMNNHRVDSQRIAGQRKGQPQLILFVPIKLYHVRLQRRSFRSEIYFLIRLILWNVYKTSKIRQKENTVTRLKGVVNTKNSQSTSFTGGVCIAMQWTILFWLYQSRAVGCRNTLLFQNTSMYMQCHYPIARWFDLPPLHILHVRCGYPTVEYGQLEVFFTSCLLLSFLRKKIMVWSKDKLKGSAHANLERNRQKFEGKI